MAINVSITHTTEIVHKRQYDMYRHHVKVIRKNFATLQTSVIVRRQINLYRVLLIQVGSHSVLHIVKLIHFYSAG